MEQPARDLGLRGGRRRECGLHRPASARATDLQSDTAVAAPPVGRGERRDGPTRLPEGAVTRAGFGRPADELLLRARVSGKHLLGIGRRHQRRGTLPSGIRALAR